VVLLPPHHLQHLSLSPVSLYPAGHPAAVDGLGAPEQLDKKKFFISCCGLLKRRGDLSWPLRDEFDVRRGKLVRAGHVQDGGLVVDV